MLRTVRRALALQLAAFAAAAVAQPERPTFLVTVPNPGARSVGFGGAFVALADDATAAFSNPAGLDQLARPELSAEVRFDFSRDVPGTESGPDLTGLGFFSYVYPGREWSMAVFSNGVASASFGHPSTEVFEVESYGLAAAYRVSDAVSVGVGLSFFDGDLRGMSSADWAVTGGVLWRLSPSWRVGAVYRQGADLDLDLGQPSILTLDLPDTAGLGVAFRTQDGKFTAAFEYDRVRYSALLDHLPDEGLILEDGDEIHLGGEYAFLGTKPLVALRLGLWRDPDHLVRGLGQRARGAETHQTFGLGLVFRRLQLDLGTDVSDSETTLSISLVYGF